MYLSEPLLALLADTGSRSLGSKCHVLGIDAVYARAAVALAMPAHSLNHTRSRLSWCLDRSIVCSLGGIYIVDCLRKFPIESDAPPRLAPCRELPRQKST